MQQAPGGLGGKNGIRCNLTLDGGNVLLNPLLLLCLRFQLVVRSLQLVLCGLQLCPDALGIFPGRSESTGALLKVLFERPTLLLLRGRWALAQQPQQRLTIPKYGQRQTSNTSNDQHTTRRRWFSGTKHRDGKPPYLRRSSPGTLCPQLPTGSSQWPLKHAKLPKIGCVGVAGLAMAPVCLLVRDWVKAGGTCMDSTVTQKYPHRPR